MRCRDWLVGGLAAVVVFVLLMTWGWQLRAWGVQDGRLDPDWSRFGLYIWPDEQLISVEDGNGHGCTWTFDAVWVMYDEEVAADGYPG